MTNVLGKGAGVFYLHNSDIQAGSYFTETDLTELFSVEASALADIPSKEIEGVRVFNESDVRKAWYSGAISGAPAHKIRNFQRSMDELIVAKLIELEYPGVEIEHQAKWTFDNNGRKSNRSLDLVIKHPEFGTKIIEFHGPQHFAAGRYGAPEENPMVRKAQIEEQFGVECVIWPYWIQLCRSNVRAVFEPGVKGFGLLWSTNTHFGDFVFPDSAQLILNLSDRFGALRHGGVGYFYGPNTEGRNNPAHPIIDSIQAGRKAASKLTHYEDDAADACVIWVHAIRNNLLDKGDPDPIMTAVDKLPPERQEVWRERIRVARRGKPDDFPNNGWVVSAFQAAVSVVYQLEEQPKLAIERAVRCGWDTDTVAAIAGAYVGSLPSALEYPQDWLELLHGWPKYTSQDLARCVRDTFTRE